MKYKFILNIFVSILCVSSYASISDASCIIKLRVNDSPPSYSKDSSGNWVGFVVEQGNAVITEAGCKVEYRSVPWARALRLLENGEIDMMGLMSITEERKKIAYFIGPNYIETIRLFVKKDSDYNIQKHEDLKNLPRKILLERGAYYGEKIEQLLKNVDFKKNIQWTSRTALTTANIERVKTGRVSGFFSHVKPGALKNITLELKYHPFVIHSNPVYFGLSKKSVNPSMQKRLKEALKGLRERGEFERIEKKYQ